MRTAIAEFDDDFDDPPSRRGTDSHHARPRKLIPADIDPWPEPVDLKELISSLTETIRAAVHMSEAAALTVALWALHTHALIWLEFTPRLVIRSRQPSCGKSTLLSLLSELVPRPFAIAAGNPRAVLWSLDFDPTLLLDDADGLIAGSKDIRALLRSGSRSNAYIANFTKGAAQTRSLFCAVALALDGDLPKSLAGQSIQIFLEPDPDRGCSFDAPPEAADPARFPILARKMARWPEDHSDRIGLGDTPLRLPTNARNWLPVIAIAADAGQEWKERAIAAMQIAQRELMPATLELLLADIRTIFEETKLDRIRSTHLAELLGKMDGRPWPNWANTGQPITTHAVARILAQAGINPVSLHFREGANGHRAGSGHGYEKESFAAAFQRLPPPVSAGERVTPTPGFSHSPSLNPISLNNPAETSPNLPL